MPSAINGVNPYRNYIIQNTQITDTNETDYKLFKNEIEIRD